MHLAGAVAALHVVVQRSAFAQRDARDANRTVAPFKPAPDAHVVDSTSLTPEEVVAHILNRLEGVGVVPERAKG